MLAEACDRPRNGDVVAILKEFKLVVSCATRVRQSRHRRSRNLVRLGIESDHIHVEAVADARVKDPD